MTKNTVQPLGPFQALKVAFYRRFLPKKVKHLGIRRADIFMLSDGTRFFREVEDEQVRPTGGKQPLAPLDPRTSVYADPDQGASGYRPEGFHVRDDDEPEETLPIDEFVEKRIEI